MLPHQLIDNGCKLIAEGAHMPLTSKAIDAVRSARLLFGPGKAASGGGVAVPGLEISQNRTASPLTREEVSDELHTIMKRIHDQCAEAGETKQYVDYGKGANVAAFKLLVDAVVGQGIA